MSLGGSIIRNLNMMWFISKPRPLTEGEIVTDEDKFMREAMADITDYDIDMLISITPEEWMELLSE